MSVNDYTKQELDFVIKDLKKNKIPSDPNRVLCLMLNLWTNYQDFVEKHNSLGGMFDLGTVRIGTNVLTEKQPKYNRIELSVQMFMFAQKELNRKEKVIK